MSELSLTPKQRTFATLVAEGNSSEWAAYQQAYGCSESHAKRNASRTALKPHVRDEILRLRALLDAQYAKVMDGKTKKGRLARVILEGSDADAIRAIQVHNQMEERERELGKVEEDTFDTLILAICRRRRMLPQDDPYDGSVDIDADIIS